VASSFEFDLLHAQQNESAAASMLEQNATSLASIGRQVEELQRHLATIPATILVRRRLDAQRAADVYIAEIARLSAERARILAEAAGPAPEGLESLDRRLDRLRELLSADLKAQQAAPEIAVEERNPEYVETNQAIGRLASERVGNQAKAELLQQSHVAAAARARRLRSLEPRYVQLKAEVVRAEEAVRQADVTLAEAEQKRALRQGEFSSLSTIEDASLPLEKEGPERLRLILGAAAAGLFAAIVVAVLRAMSDSVIRRPQDVEALDGVSVIGMMPKLGRRNLRRHALARARGY
jgi:capsular polysaccharide biosynthesis protein